MIERLPISRRDFLGKIVSAGALVLAAPLFSEVAGKTWQPSVYLAIEPDGSVKIVAHRSEMGTGCRTALPKIVADELEADWQRVRVIQAPADARYGSQNTDGSCSVRDFYDPLRAAGASARNMLEQAAASQWGVPVADCQGQNHFVVHAKSGRKLAYGVLVAAADVLPVPTPDAIRLKRPEQFRYIGRDVPMVDMQAIITGQAIFGHDVNVPGMIYASIERPPFLGGTMKSCDDVAARQVTGVQQVVVMDLAKPPYGFQALGGAAVLADNSWAALQGRKKLKVEWDPGPNAAYDSREYRTRLLDAVKKPGRVARDTGNVDAEFAKGGKVLEASYYTPMLAHAPMETPAALADFKNGKVEIWTATQNPQGVQETVAKALGIAKEAVLCHVTLLGGGFGRKSKPDYVAEAAILSKQAGKPVKVVWSREDDIHFDYFHSPASMYLKAAMDNQGLPTAWLQRSAFPPIGSQNDPEEQYGGWQLSLGASDIPYTTANLRVENCPARAHVRIGWLRSVSNIYHAFGIQSFVDELAAAAGRDRVEYQLAMLGKPRVIDFAKEGMKEGGLPEDPKFLFDTGRLRNVLEKVAEKSGWAKKKPGAGRALGLAVHRSLLSYVAAVVEVEVGTDGAIRIPRVDLALDAGRIIDPDRVRAQFEGSAVFGAGIAMMSEITVSGGRFQQTNFDGYRVPRMTEAPLETHIHLVSSDAPPSGVGEPGVPPIAPAICNAIFAATGKRIRDLPIAQQLA